MASRRKAQASSLEVPKDPNESLAPIIDAPSFMSAPPREITHVAGPERTNSKLDIIFIHGLSDRWEQTWDGLELPEPWLSTLLPKDVPDASIMTYGFNVLDWIDPDLDSIKEAARLFTIDLEAKREEIDRPVVFVAHSLGGIVLREALLQTSDASFGFYIQGIVFISTPNFSTAEEWTEFGNRLSKAVAGSRNASFYSLEQVERQSSSKNLDSLASMSTINRNFEDWLERTSTHSVYCFHETVPIYRIGVVVPSTYASIARIPTSALRQDHTSITKFDSSMDQSYRILSKTLRMLSRPSADLSASIPALEQRPPVSRQSKSGSFNGLPPALDGREVLVESKRDDSRRAAKLANLALALEDLGRFKEAEDTYRRAVDEFPENPTPEDPIHLFCLYKLASVLRDRSKYPEAEIRARDAWQARLKAYGLNHQATLLSAGSLVRILRFRGKYTEAYVKLANALGPFEACPYDSIGGTNAVSILAKILKDLGLYKTSEFLARNVIGACIYHLDTNHPYTFNRQSDLAVVLSKQHKFEAAYRVGQGALNGLQQTLGTDHPHTLRTAKRVANYLRFQGNLDDAKLLLNRVLDTQIQLAGSRENDMLSTICSLAAVDALQGRFDKALDALKQALDDRRKLFGDGHDDTAWTKLAVYAVRKLIQLKVTPEKLQSEIESQQAVNTSMKSTRSMSEEISPTSSTNSLTEKRAESKPKEHTKEDYESPKELKSIVKFLLSPTVPKDHKEVDERRIFQDLFCYVRHYGKDSYAITPEEAAHQNLDSDVLGLHLQAAAARNDEKVVRILLERVKNPKNLINDHLNVLQGASYGGNPDIMKLLLDWFDAQRFDLRRRPEILGRTLRVAAALGKTELIKMLVSRRVDVNGKGAYFGSALQAACFAGHVKTVEYLIEHKANVNQKAGLLASPLRAAALQGHAEIVRLLLDNGAKLSVQGTGIGSALQAALLSGDELTLDNLFEKRDRAHDENIKAAVNWEDSTFGTPLQEAAWAGNETLVALLLDNGADPSIHSGVIESPLEMAAASGHVRIVDLLLTGRIDDDLDDFDGALRLAAIAGHSKVLDRLLNDERVEDFRGFSTALQAASVADQPEMTRKIFNRAKATLESKGVCGTMEQAVLTYTIDADYTID